MFHFVCTFCACIVHCTLCRWVCFTMSVLCRYTCVTHYALCRCVCFTTSVLSTLVLGYSLNDEMFEHLFQIF